jgi:alkanesulfonate monooxygenase SsuD/methylene tetrahydromethanopterin reductase-like flavin-dependent oxidoreductase (luciferase family)
MRPYLTLSLAGTGYHPASWRFSSLPPAPSAAVFQSLARNAERACLDAIVLGLPVTGSFQHANTMQLDPLPLLGSLVAVTDRIGLAAGWTVDFTEPFHVARVFATLDHLSYGRTAWFARILETKPLLPLIGKSPEAPDVAAYCARTGEFIAVVKKLWDSWEDEGFTLDKASGMFADPDRVHPINHAGEYFNVRGPLNVPRPPQGNPVLILRDSPDPTARQLIASVADVILIDRPSKSRYQELRTLAAGRDIRILANMLCILEATKIAAEQRAKELDAYLPTPQDCSCFVGTPAQFVELLSDCCKQESCDGFNLLPAVLPDDVSRIVGAIESYPVICRSAYAGKSLREHLDLARPGSCYASGSTY